MRFGRLGVQIILVIVLPVLLISLSVGIVSTLRLNRLIRSQAEYHLDQYAADASSGLSAEVKLIENAMGIAAESLGHHYSDFADPDTLISGETPFFEHTLGYFPGAVGMQLILLSGDESTVTSIYISRGTYGNPFTRPPTSESRNEWHDESVRAIESGLPTWSDVHFSDKVGQQVLTFSTPIHSDTGIIGALEVDFVSEEFRDLLDRYDYGETGYAFLYSSEERIIYHPALSFGLSLDEFRDPGADHLKAQFRLGLPKGSFTYEYAGSEKMMAYRRLDNGWFLGVTLELEELRRPAINSLQSMAVIAAAAFIVALGLSLLVTRVILDPLNRMHDRTKLSIQGGTDMLDLSDVGRRSDEIGDLARAFAELDERNRRNLDLLLTENLEKEKLAAMGDKLPDLSHEVDGKLGTVVTGISFVRDSLKKTDTDSAMVETLDIALKSIQQASRIMKSVKNTSSAQLTTDRGVYSLRELIEDVAVSLQHLIRKRDISIDIRILPELLLDRHSGYLVQVMDNLIGNSLKHGFADADRGRIVISASGENDRLVLDYMDDGRGISPDLAGQVFDRFYTTARDSGGTGIGLYIVRALVEQEMDGRVELLDKDGPGVHFRMTFDDMSPVRD